MTNTKKHPTSINPGPHLEAYLAALGPRGPREGVSRMIEQMAGRYLFSIRGSLPDWQVEDWNVVIEALREHDMGAAPGLQALGLVVQASIEHKKPGVGTPLASLAYQAKRLTAPSLVAVAEMVEGYWRRHDALDTEQLTNWLRLAGAPGFNEPTSA